MKSVVAFLALLALLCLSTVIIAAQGWQADQDAQGHKLYGLPSVPDRGSGAVPLSFVTPGAGILNSTGVNGSVTIYQGAGLSVLGRNVNSTGADGDIVAGADNQVLARTSSTLGFQAIDYTFTNTTATYSRTGVLVGCVDGVNGNDANLGYAISADTTQGNVATATQTCGAAAKKTWASMVAALAPIGNGRQVYVVVNNANAATNGTTTYTDRFDQLAQLNGYSTVAIRATGTNTTAGCTAFDGSTADLTYQGAVTATGMNATGYTVNAGVTSDTIQLTKVGGGSPSFPAETAKPYYVRGRFDNATTTTGLRNKAFSVVEVIDAQTIRLGKVITVAAGDVIYLEEQGVVFSSTATQVFNQVDTSFGIFGISFGAGLQFNRMSANLIWVQTPTANSIVMNDGVLNVLATQGIFAGAPDGTTTVVGPTRTGTVQVTRSSAILGNRAPNGGTNNGALGTTGNVIAIASYNFAIGSWTTVGGDLDLNGGGGAQSNFSLTGAIPTAGANPAVVGGANTGTAGVEAPTRVLGTMYISGGARVTLGSIKLPSTSAAYGIRIVGTNDVWQVDKIYGGTKTDAGIDVSQSRNSRISYVSASAPLGITLTGANGDVFFGQTNSVSPGNIYANVADILAASDSLKLPNGDYWTRNFQDTGLSSYVGSTGGQIGFFVGNGSGSTINGQRLIRSGAPGDANTIQPLRADSASTIDGAIGYLVSTVPNGQGSIAIYNGVVPVLWDVTNPGAGGVAAWVSATTTGEVAATMPTSPNQARFVGWSVGEGTVQLMPDNRPATPYFSSGIAPTGVGYVKSAANSVGLTTSATVPATDVTGLFYQTVGANATSLAQRPLLNFSSLLAATDNSGAGRTDVTLANTAVTPGSYTSTNLTVDAQGRITAASNGSSGGYTTVEANGTPVTARSILNFNSAFGVVDNGGATRTDVSLVVPAASDLMISDGTKAVGDSNAQYDTTNHTLLLGGATATAGQRLDVVGSQTLASGTSLTWDPLFFDPGTLTLTGTTHVTTAAGLNGVTIKAPTITDASAVTVDNSATLAVLGPPAAGGSVTGTHKFAIWSEDGTVRLDSSVNGTGVPTDPDHAGLFINAVGGNDAQLSFGRNGAMTGSIMGKAGSMGYYAPSAGSFDHQFFFDSPSGGAAHFYPSLTSTANTIVTIGGAGIRLGGSGAGSTNPSVPLVIDSLCCNQAISLPGAFMQQVYKSNGEFRFGTSDANDLNIQTNSTTRIGVASGGGVTISSLGSGLVKSTSGLLANASHPADYLAEGDMPAAADIMISAGTAAAPTGTANFKYDTTNDFFEISGGAVIYDLDLGAAPSGNFSGFLTNWVGHVMNVQAVHGGTGVSRAYKISTVAGVTIDDELSVNGPAALPNSAFQVGHTTTADHDHVQMYLGGGAQQDSPDNALFEMFPAATTIPAGRTTGVWAVERIDQWALTGASSPTITEADSLYIADAPSITSATGSKYAVHVAAGKTRLAGAVQLDSMVGPGLLSVDGSGNVSELYYGGNATKHDYFLNIVVNGALFTGEWAATSSAAFIGTGIAIEYPNDFVAGHVQETFDLIAQTGTAGAITCSVTMNGTIVSGTGFTFTIGTTANGVYTNSAVATGSASINDTFGVFCQGTAPTTGGLASWSEQVVLLP